VPFRFHIKSAKGTVEDQRFGKGRKEPPPHITSHSSYPNV